MTLAVDISNTGSTVYTESVYQHDKNVTIVFEGADLPDEYEVIFSNTKDRGISVSCEGTPAGVLIPDELLSTGEYVYVWVRLVSSSEEKTEKSTVASVTIPVIPRPVPISVGSTSTKPIINRYEIHPDEEDLEFTGYMNHIINHDMEEET